MTELPRIPQAEVQPSDIGFIALACDDTPEGQRAFRESLTEFVKSSTAWIIYRRYSKGKKSQWTSAKVVPFLP